MLQIAFRVLLASILTVGGIVGAAYLANIMALGKGLIITSSVIAGICGFVIGVYWTMTYLTQSGFGKKQISSLTK